MSLTVNQLAETFDCSAKQITWGITLVLMFRSVGAVIFGLAADRYGRKWPYVANLCLFIVLELGTGFTNNLHQFLGIRAIYGVAMGGLYGMAAATALEDCPPSARGIVSGMLQQGYAFGYLLATAFARGLVDTTRYAVLHAIIFNLFKKLAKTLRSHGWRPLYWFGACPPILIIIFRIMMPETETFQQRQRIRQAGQHAGKTFVQEGKVALKRHWLLLVYLVLLMAGFNFLSHVSFSYYHIVL